MTEPFRYGTEDKAMKERLHRIEQRLWLLEQDFNAAFVRAPGNSFRFRLRTYAQLRQGRVSDEPETA